MSKLQRLFTTALLTLAGVGMAAAPKARAQLPSGSVPGAEDVTLASGRDRAGFRLASGELTGGAGVDLVVGAPNGDGVVRIYDEARVTRSGTLPPSEASVQIDGFGGMELGWALAVGDFTGDGADDLAIGAPSEVANGKNGVVYVFTGPIAPGVHLVSDAQIQIEAPANATDYFGWTLSAGDLDGDGRDDLVVGDCADVSSTFALFELGSGRYRVGSLGLASTSFTGVALAGCALATGDLDGDGYDDLAIAAPGEPIFSGAPGAGAVFVVYGRATFAASYDIVPPNALPDVEAFARGLASRGIGVLYAGGIARGANVGWSLAIGDLRRSGEPELLIGAPSERCDGCIGFTGTGRVFVVDGGRARWIGLVDLRGTAGVTEHRARVPDDGYGFDVAVLGHDRPSLSNVFAVGAPRANEVYFESFALEIEEPSCSVEVTEAGRLLHCDAPPTDGSFAVIDAGTGGAVSHGDPDSAFGWTVHPFARGPWADVFVAAPFQRDFEELVGDARVYGFHR